MKLIATSPSHGHKYLSWIVQNGWDGKHHFKFSVNPKNATRIPDVSMRPLSKNFALTYPDAKPLEFIVADTKGE